LTGRWLTLSKVLRTRVPCAIVKNTRESLVRAQALCSVVLVGLTREDTNMKVYKISDSLGMMDTEFQSLESAEFALSMAQMFVEDQVFQIHEIEKEDNHVTH